MPALQQLWKINAATCGGTLPLGNRTKGPFRIGLSAFRWLARQATQGGGLQRSRDARLVGVSFGAGSANAPELRDFFGTELNGMRFPVGRSSNECRVGL